MRVARNRMATVALVAAVGLAGVACSEYDGGGTSPGQEEGVTDDGGGADDGAGTDDSGLGY